MEKAFDNMFQNLKTILLNIMKKKNQLDLLCIKHFQRHKWVDLMINDNGDLTDKKTRILFGGNFKQRKADFITADGGFDWKNENIQEQEAFKLILAQIIWL